MKNWLIATTLSLSFNAYGLGVEVPYESFETQHKNQVTWVVSCGSWPAKQGTGFYRITHAKLNGQSFLYAQWMVANTQSDLNTVELTQSISELNNDHADVSLSNLRCEPTKSGVNFSALAYLGHENKSRKVRVILLQTPGKYTVRGVRPS